MSPNTKKNFSYADVQGCLIYPHRIEGDPTNISFNKASNLENSDDTSLIWLGAAKVKNPQELASLKANLVIAHQSLEDLVKAEGNQTFIFTEAPKETFIQILQKLFVSPPQAMIHPNAIIDPEAKIDNNVSIGAFCLIGKCEIGEGSIIHSHVVVHDQSKIGKRVLIKSHTTIGSDGFGYSKTQEGHYVKFPHLGGVVLEDDVEVGSNTCIDRGTLGNTVIGQNSKIDNLVHVAHNVKLGKNCLVIANVLIGGSTELGDDCWVAPSATLRDGLKITSGVTIGMGALVTKDLDVPGVYLGSPAKLKI
ncbi:MAG: UDP-3-O-(3-hydroxymyristoyl)glucosamine N-acyltransferase [Saprospiraceae bacterium]|nr:UDP-3-O-(3-hydroxymyristoyl)glucosamine N-acyltransferase [Saprospiraceae bacterium]